MSYFALRASPVQITYIWTNQAVKHHSKSDNEHGESEGESKKCFQHINKHHNIYTKVGELSDVQ